MHNFIFDVDDTLYDQIIPFKSAFNEVFKEYPSVNIHELYISHRYHSDQLFFASSTGMMTLT